MEESMTKPTTMAIFLSIVLLSMAQLPSLVAGTGRPRVIIIGAGISGTHTSTFTVGDIYVTQYSKFTVYVTHSILSVTNRNDVSCNL